MSASVRTILTLIPVLATAPALAQTSPPPTGTELSWSSGASRIGAFTSRAWASRGKGVTIAIVDTGVRTDHNEFKGALTGGYNAFTDATGVSAVADTNGHGTHVASLAAARANGIGMAGVASLANILPIQVFQGPTTASSLIAKGISYATSRNAFIINLSLGSSSPDASMRSAMQAAQKAGQLMVVAAGNEGAINPSWPARHASEAWANGQIIAVGAVDQNNVIASFSNRAGDARNFYLVAPGTGLIGAYHTSPSTYAMMSGTSMAAPIVSGAAAVVKSAWPYLTAKNTAEILFRTATDLGDKGIDAIYGRGLLNLEKALLPVGNVTTVGLAGTSPLALAPGSTGQVTTGAKTAAAAAGLFTGAVFDSFGRDFGFDFARLSQRTRSDAVGVLNEDLERRMDDGLRAAGSGSSEGRAILRPRFAEVGAEAASTPLGVFMFQNGPHERWAISAGRRSPILDATYAPLGAPSSRLGDYQAATALFSPSAITIAGERAISRGLRLRFGGRVESSDLATYNPLRQGLNATTTTSIETGLAYRTDRYSLSADLSRIQESNSRLGDIETAALALRGRAATTSLNLTAGLRLGDDMSLTGRMAGTISDRQAGEVGSLVRDVSETGSLGYSVSLARRNLFAQGDAFELSAGTPLTSRSGVMSLFMSVGANPETGAPIMADRRISLGSPTLERRIEMNYIRPVGRDASLGMALMSRFDADGQEGENDHSAMIRFVRRF